MLDQALGDDLRHDFVGVVDALAALEAQRIGHCIREVGRVSESLLVSLACMGGSIAAPSERNKNAAGYFPKADFVANGRDGGGESSGPDGAFAPICTIMAGQAFLREGHPDCECEPLRDELS
jgi:hypothetical protein